MYNTACLPSPALFDAASSLPVFFCPMKPLQNVNNSTIFPPG
ncbi:hypothetical protein HMPREF0880_03252 [Yokenella regensburgei ATCC 43003]|nr:hypothetical protein HMPREF0880_03252 [Yokenella regensburgei ATCC 43003]